jgi:hypothetical protein
MGNFPMPGSTWLALWLLLFLPLFPRYGPMTGTGFERKRVTFRTISASFVQEKHLEILIKPLVSKGRHSISRHPDQRGPNP